MTKEEVGDVYEFAINDDKFFSDLLAKLIHTADKRPRPILRGWITSLWQDEFTWDEIIQKMEHPDKDPTEFNLWFDRGSKALMKNEGIVPRDAIQTIFRITEV